MRAWWIVVLCFAMAAPWAGTGWAQVSQDLDAQAHEAYRRGDYSLAITLWQDQLEQLGEIRGTSEVRGELCYNVANALYRSDQAMQAVAWYEAARRHLPRDADLLANLNFVRGELGLDPLHGDGLGATLMGWVRSWTSAEARRIAVWALFLWAWILIAEAWWGGRWARRAVWIGALLMLLAWLPWLRSAWVGEGPKAMIVSDRGTSGRSEPRTSARALVSLAPATAVDPLDAWQDWVKVRTPEGKEVWVGAEKVLSTWR